MKVSVVGLGKIGLPLAIQIASKGHEVLGCDVSSVVVDMVNEGTPPFTGEPGSDRLKDLVNKSLITATSDTTSAVSQSEVVVVLVPLLVDTLGEPLFDSIVSATTQIARGLRPGSTVIYETTLPIGTTRNLFGPILERESGLFLGKNLFLGFSPERVYSGNVLRNLREYPKLVGGVDSESTRRVLEFYQEVLDFDERSDLDKRNGVWDLGSTEAAEFAKLAETTYRDVNIALANEFASHAESLGVNVYEIIEACNSQPYSHIHQPGISVGGHCIPVYPHFYLKGHPEADLVATARRINSSTPKRVLEMVKTELGVLSGKTVAILGLAYRGGVKEHAFSGAIALASLFTAEGAEAKIHDPLYSEVELRSLGLSPYALGDFCDAVILQTDHHEYQNIKTSNFPGAKFFVDGRNFSAESFRSKIKTQVVGVGVQP
jgi:nucleotide sugar dehydrogenase